MKTTYLLIACLAAFSLSFVTLVQDNPFMQKIAPLNEAKLNRTETTLSAGLKREASSWNNESFNAIVFTGPNFIKKRNIAGFLAQKKNAGLFIVDLSRVVSGNILTTRRNLDIVFENAAGKNVVLLFDEGESLFGRRTNVNNSHNRYDSAGTAYFIRQLVNYRTSIIMSVKNETAVNPVLFENFVRFDIH
ncbi:MAG: AAA family ATPase [Rhizobacter sp.]|nr:AAA family ATPase [Ferruginibacter sp.]